MTDVNSALNNLDSFSFFGPQLVLTVGSTLMFLFDLTIRRSKNRVALLSWATLGVLALTGGAVAMLPPQTTLLFGGLLGNDGLATFFDYLFLASAAFTVLLCWPSREVIPARLGEFYALLLALTLGMFLMAQATDLLMVYLGLELVSLLSYVLAGFRTGDRKGNEAAMKYVIYGGVASGIMLYGMSILYGLFGTTHLVGAGSIAQQVSGVAESLFAARAFAGQAAAELSLIVAVIFVTAGIGYKIASVPFHMWCPDVYEGAPTPFTAFLSVGPKAAGFAVAIRFFYAGLETRGLAGVFTSGITDVPWPAVLGIIAAVTMTLGNLTALVQTNLKRLLAYSSIAHAGYILMGLTAVTSAGVESVMLYLVVYLFMNVGAFLCVLIIADSTGSENIAEYRGLASKEPVTAIAFAIFLFALTGLPPFAGFTGKWLLFAAIVQKGGFWYYVLALIGVANSAVSLYYYARIVRAMFLDAPVSAAKVVVPRLWTAMLVGLALPTLILGVSWGWLSDLAAASFAKLAG